MLYIKFNEGSISSLKIACREAERLGYVKYPNENAIDFEWLWILIIQNNAYRTTAVHPSLFCIKPKHHKINPLRKLYYYLTT